MDIFETCYGNIPHSKPLGLYKTNEVKECYPAEKCVLDTSAGIVVPQYTDDELRSKDVSPVMFYKSGRVKSIALQEAAEIQTPAGPLPAELVTFHENGTVNRLFPLNGKLSGYWSQEDEAALARPLSIETSLGRITAKMISICFYDTGVVRSLTFWPGESVNASTPAGDVEVRIGISFYPDGKLESLEPSGPSLVRTAIGNAMAYDPDAVGVNADCNSLGFDRQGRVLRLATTMTGIMVTGPDGGETGFFPKERESLCSESEKEIVPMHLEFSGDNLDIRQTLDSELIRVPLDGNAARAVAHMPKMANGLGVMHCSV